MNTPETAINPIHHGNGTVIDSVVGTGVGEVGLGVGTVVITLVTFGVGVGVGVAFTILPSESYTSVPPRLFVHFTINATGGRYS